MGLDVKKLKEKYDNRGKEKSGDRWKPSKGENVVRVLPHTIKYFTETVDDIAHSFLMHFNVGPEGSKEAVVCPKTPTEGLTWAQARKHRCPICEFAAQMKKSDDPKDQAIASDLNVRKRYLINIIDLKSEETIAKGIQVTECGPKIYEGIIQWCNEKWGDPLDLELGRNLSIIKTVPPSGDESRTEYKVEPDPEKSSIAAKLPKNWKEQLSKIDTLVPKIKSYDELKAALEGDVDYGSETKEVENVPGHEGVASHTDTAASIKEAQPAPVVKAGNGAKPDCFSKLFSNRNEKCIACPVNAECKVEFLKP